MTKSGTEKELAAVERAQAELRQTIERTRQLTGDAQRMVDKNKKPPTRAE